MKYILFKYHVVGETSLPNPGFLPYYDQNLFSTIKHYQDTCTLNISVMTTKQWYQILLEDRVLMQPGAAGAPQVLLPFRVEQLEPEQDWPATWTLSRTKGLSSEQTTFLFKLLHQLLPTQDRINRITNEPGLCKICHAAPEDLHHALFTCTSSRPASDLLISYVHTVIPGLSPQKLLRLDFGAVLEESDKLATLCLISTSLKYIWQARADKKTVTQYKMRAEVEAVISILRKTRYSASADRLLEIII